MAIIYKAMQNLFLGFQ